MELPLKLERFAFHYVDMKLDRPVYAEQEVDLARLPEPIQEFLLAMVSEIWDAPDAGTTRSARFAESQEASPARVCLETLLKDDGAFFAASRQIADLLRQRSHPSASPGVLGVMRLAHYETGKRFVALVKIRHRDEQLVRLEAPNLPRLDVERVQNVLRKEIQKGALLPHPDKDDYDVKVIDAQSREDPAAYFTEKFLGCYSKKSDDLQVRKLTPALERFAEERELSLAVERLPQVFQRLQDQPEDITAPVLAEAISEEGLFGEPVAPEEFSEYLDQVHLGDLDIPKEQFERKRKTARKVIYRFIDPELEGLEISGPPEVLSRILKAEGDQVIFTVSTDSGGFHFGYR